MYMSARGFKSSFFLTFAVRYTDFILSLSFCVRVCVVFKGGWSHHAANPLDAP